MDVRIDESRRKHSSISVNDPISRPVILFTHCSESIVANHYRMIAQHALAAIPIETSRMAERLVSGWGNAAEASAVGFPRRLPALSAAFVNGVLAHTLDFDDTHLPSVLHPSASVLPAALAVAESTGASVEEMIAAAAVGYEICVRTGMGGYDRELGNSVFFEYGWHATSICGALASAAIAAKLYGLDANGIGHALGIAASMASGILEGNRAGGTVKRLHCGWAAHAGIAAAQAARAGFTAPASTLEGHFGFYKAFCRGFINEDEIVRGLGSEWSVPGIFFKPYPANHFTHAGIDAALKLVVPCCFVRRLVFFPDAHGCVCVDD